eukprot:CAMPEP_0114695312 /NCGR_PEP_ID=MMETSP0191-20121206/71224_1 /TAXON_ID=126664 /ORGANISM="Sorites sp." /LENGTH=152 /DNA_ID=CAMNT_0001991413 /DNA_START=36 /DNA_END=491 /DNA_ORIENTATION=-
MKVFHFHLSLLLVAFLLSVHLPLALTDADTDDLLDLEECDSCGHLSLLQLRTAQRTEAEANASSDQVPMIPYPRKYCQHCGEMAFCHRASNPGCGGHAMGGVASFNNHIKAHGCRSQPTLTVPRSYVRDIGVLAHYPGAQSLLREMLVNGFL